MEKLEAYRSWLSRPIKKLLVKNHMERRWTHFAEMVHSNVNGGLRTVRIGTFEKTAQRVCGTDG